MATMSRIRSSKQPIGTILSQRLAAPLQRIKIRTVGELEDCDRAVLDKKLGAILTNEIATACEKRGILVQYRSEAPLPPTTQQPSKKPMSPDLPAPPCVVLSPELNRKRGRKPFKRPTEKSITSLKLDHANIICPLRVIGVKTVDQLIEYTDQRLTEEAKLTARQIATIDRNLAKAGFSRTPAKKDSG